MLLGLQWADLGVIEGLLGLEGTGKPEGNGSSLNPIQPREGWIPPPLRVIFNYV